MNATEKAQNELTDTHERKRMLRATKSRLIIEVLARRREINKVCQEREKEVNAAVQARRKAVDEARACETILVERTAQRDKLDAICGEALHALLTFCAIKFPGLSLYTSRREDKQGETYYSQAPDPPEIPEEARFIEHLNYVLTKAV